MPLKNYFPTAHKKWPIIYLLQKFALPNLKLSSRKTFIFPLQADILSWIWKQGGKLEPSPHRKNSLINIKTEDIRKVKYEKLNRHKTLRRATPNIYSILEPLENAVTGANNAAEFI